MRKGLIIFLAFIYACVVNGDDNLNIFVIPHSHCDPGWLNTFESYYVRDVSKILDGVVAQLGRDPSKKFIWAETSFFEMWYERLDEARKSDFKRLVDNGQLEFVGGGWAQHDEANPDIPTIINQMTEGHRYLLNNFGVAPKIGWQIDPFGHSSVTPSLFALIGFDAMVINRIHHKLKLSFKSNRGMEFVWRGGEVGENTDIFTHVLHTHYSAPKGFDWEEASPRITDANVATRAAAYVRVAQQRAGAYRTKNLLVPFGDDFKFKNAGLQFSMMDKVIREINSNPHKYSNVRIQYATLSDYFKAVGSVGSRFPIFSGDFYPYADNEDSYWTGYYTTRPFLKQLSRRLDRAFRVAEQLYTFSRSKFSGSTDLATFWEEGFRHLQTARRNGALFTHHDAITGTSRIAVVNDYQRKMQGSLEALYSLSSALLAILVQKGSASAASSVFSARPLTLSPKLDGSLTVFPLTVHNSLAWERQEMVTYKTQSRYVKVLSAEGQVVRAQVDPIWDNLASKDPAQSLFQVVFLAQVPPLGAITYFITVSSQPFPADEQNVAESSIATVYLENGALLSGGRGGGTMLRGGADVSSKYLEFLNLETTSPLSIQNDWLKLVVSSVDGLLDNIEDVKNDEHHALKHYFARYRTDRSGAYLFRPTARPIPLSDAAPRIVRIVNGPVQSSIVTQFSFFEVIYTLIHDPSLALGGHFQLTQTVFTEQNTELVSIFKMDLRNDGEFYTSSGLGFLNRKPLAQSVASGAPLSANFFPMVTGARMEDTHTGARFTIMNPHTMACGSHEDGEIELMVARSLSQDDGRGLAQAVIDSTHTKMRLWLTLDRGMSNKVFFKKSLRLNSPLTQFYPANSKSLDGDKPMESFLQSFSSSWQPLPEPLGDEVHLLSLHVRDSVSDDIVLRLQSIEPDTSTSTWKRSATSIFNADYPVSEVRLVTLTANFAIDPTSQDSYRMRFATEEGQDMRYQFDLAPPLLDGQTNQNSEEEGVFISQSALDNLIPGEDEQAPPPPPTPARAPISHTPIQAPRHGMPVAPPLPSAAPLPIASPPPPPLEPPPPPPLAPPPPPAPFVQTPEVPVSSASPAMPGSANDINAQIAALQAQIAAQIAAAGNGNIAAVGRRLLQQDSDAKELITGSVEFTLRPMQIKSWIVRMASSDDVPVMYAPASAAPVASVINIVPLPSNEDDDTGAITEARKQQQKTKPIEPAFPQPFTKPSTPSPYAKLAVDADSIPAATNTPSNTAQAVPVFSPQPTQQIQQPQQEGVLAGNSQQLLAQLAELQAQEQALIQQLRSMGIQPPASAFPPGFQIPQLALPPALQSINHVDLSHARLNANLDRSVPQWSVGHTHELEPGKIHVWRKLMPKRSEYVVLVLLSLAAILFYCYSMKLIHPELDIFNCSENGGRSTKRAAD